MYAFFDVDETLIRIKSMFDILPYLYRETELEVFSEDSMKKFFIELKKDNIDRSSINRKYYRNFKGVNRDKLLKSVDAWFKDSVCDRKNFYYMEILNILKKEKKKGREPVFVSGSMKEFLIPIANDIGVKNILSIELDINKNIFSGDISSIQTISEGKSLAIHDFLEKNKTEAKLCSSFGDHISDKWMLELCGKPYVVGNNIELCEYGKRNHWSHIDNETGEISCL